MKRKIKQFSYDSLEDNDYDEDDFEDDEDDGYGDESSPCLFTAAMITTCHPLLNDLEDNYDVRDRLIRAGVIDDTCRDDTESCQLWVYFKTQSDGREFIDRLNKYLRDRAEKKREARDF